jgi:hypothetical protein
MTANSESFVKDSVTSHPMIRWYDYSLLVTTTKRSRGYVDSPFQQAMRQIMRRIKSSKHLSISQLMLYLKSWQSIGIINLNQGLDSAVAMPDDCPIEEDLTYTVLSNRGLC